MCVIFASSWSQPSDTIIVVTINTHATNFFFIGTELCVNRLWFQKSHVVFLIIVPLLYAVFQWIWVASSAGCLKNKSNDDQPPRMRLGLLVHGPKHPYSHRLVLGAADCTYRFFFLYTRYRSLCKGGPSQVHTMGYLSACHLASSYKRIRSLNS